MQDPMAIGRRRGKGIPLTEFDRRRIQRAREDRGWTVGELAQRVGLHQSTLYRLENGTLRSTPRLTAIYTALGLPSDRMGKPERDEEELMALYRDLKRRVPSQANVFMSLARTWAARADRARLASVPLAPKAATL